jgi:prevent-host-death family protein
MAKTARISLTEAKKRLGELVKRSSYGNERFVLESHGKAQAAIVTVEDLQRLERSEIDWERGRKALMALRKIRESTKPVQWDSVEVIRAMREERDEQLLDLR